MDGHKCINACTRTGSSLWTAGSVCSVRSVCAFPPSRTMASCAVCVCTAPRAQTAFVYIPFCLSGTLLLRTHTKLSRLGPGSRLQNRGQVHWEIRENFRNAPDTCGRVFLPLQLIMFQHSRQGHRDIQCVQFHYFFFDRSQRQSCRCRAVGTTLSQNHASYCHILEWVKASFLRGAAFALLIATACNQAHPFCETSLSGRRFASNFLGILATPLISVI